MSQYSTGHDHAAPAPYAKGVHRMRYPKRAQSPASPRYDNRPLQPGELPPGSLPYVNHDDKSRPRPPGSWVPDRFKHKPPPHKAINPPQVPTTVVDEPYVNHDDKMKYPKPAPSTALPHPDKVSGGCNKSGGCNGSGADEPPQVEPTSGPGSYKDHETNTSMSNWETWAWGGGGVCLICCLVFGVVFMVPSKSSEGDEEKPEEEEEAAEEGE